MTFSIWTIAAENRFLRVLAEAVLAGFPLATPEVPLSRYTILVPNRRSARALERLLLQMSGQQALLMPRIKPIGDLDDDFEASWNEDPSVPESLPPLHHLHAILALVMDWARQNEGLGFADNLLVSGTQAFALAQSLQLLVNQAETEDVDLGSLTNVLELDLATHRDHIVSLIELVASRLPRELLAQNRMGPSAHRNLMIRREANRLAAAPARFPIIAAGSTGSNPATRDLLKAIAANPRGAVVLPGLDCQLDDAGWAAVSPEHPQYGLKTLLDQWGVARSDVRNLGEPSDSRSWLASLAMRPAAVADQWPALIAAAPFPIAQAQAGMTLVETADRPEEALVIAMRLRQHVAQSSGKAALVTPDRDLAARVTSQLGRWNLVIDDSAGQSLAREGRAALALLLLEALHANFTPDTLLALLHHPDCTCGTERPAHLETVQALEILVLRGLPSFHGISALRSSFDARRTEAASDQHAHPVRTRFGEPEWNAVDVLLRKLEALFANTVLDLPRPLAEHISLLTEMLDGLAPLSIEISPADQRFLEVFDALKQGSVWHPLLPLSKAQHSIVHALQNETLRPPQNELTQLALYGLAEARLLDAELVILGGLVAGQWPSLPDSGPWLNRPMRQTLGLQQPERDIGIKAHDFAQGLGHPQVMLSWSKRLGTAPATPARWVLRLRAVLASLGIAPKDQLSPELPELARLIDKPRRFKPTSRPQPKPPVAARPRHFSVTQVENLVRDSYWIYARKMLRLKPLDPLNQDLSGSLRGLLLHEALQLWLEARSTVQAADQLALLLAKGEGVFRPFMKSAEVAQFWWPRFVRMANDLIAYDETLRSNTIASHSEVQAIHGFQVLGVEHVLTARADRVDITQTGALRLIDYKSGKLPTKSQIETGFASQMTLQLYLASRAAFKGLHSQHVEDGIYIQVGATAEGLETLSLVEEKLAAPLPQQHMQAFEALLASFLDSNTPYVPRHHLMKQDEETEYDHLSRWREWQLRVKQP